VEFLERKPVVQFEQFIRSEFVERWVGLVLKLLWRRFVQQFFVQRRVIQQFVFKQFFATLVEQQFIRFQWRFLVFVQWTKFLIE
jgi:hypothetical protein